tara:strand:+ start:176 stop:505 length:330 start_codon:yes stop_codon:yes gene_type:complete
MKTANPQLRLPNGSPYTGVQIQLNLSLALLSWLVGQLQQVDEHKDIIWLGSHLPSKSFETTGPLVRKPIYRGVAFETIVSVLALHFVTPVNHFHPHFVQNQYHYPWILH